MGKRGPKAQPRLRRTERQELLLHPEEARQLKLAAKAAGMSVPAFIRHQCGLERPDPEDTHA